MAKIDASSFLSKLPNLLIGLIVLFSATQLGFHFWPNSALVYGIRIDYLSPTMYFLDILIVVYLSLATKSPRSDPLRRSWPTAKMFSRTSKISSETGSDLKGTLLVILLINLLYSQNPLATLSWSLHFLLYFVFLRRLLDRRPEQSSSRDKGGGRSILVGVLQFSLFFQTILATIQVYLGHSVGGLLYYLGERNVAVGSPNIALGTFMDHVVLRAYGTFSHPNILAGFAVISLLIILRLKYPSRSTIHDPQSTITLFFTFLLILLTQSRSAALSLFIFIIPIYFLKNIKRKVLYFVLLLSTIYYLQSTLTPLRSDLSSSQRLTLQGLSLSVIKDFPIFGTGTQASISTYPQVDPSVRLLQPDHNSFTLFLSWFGVFGVLAIMLSLRSTIYHLRSFLPLLPLLFFDHYLLTSPQGLFILLTYLVFAVNYSHV